MALDGARSPPKKTDWPDRHFAVGRAKHAFLRTLALAKTSVVVTGQCIGPAANMMSLGEGKRPIPPPEPEAHGDEDESKTM